MRITCRQHVCPRCQGPKDFYAKTCRRCAQHPLVDRLLDGSEPEPNSGCWLWVGNFSIDRGGSPRGVLSINNRTKLAYRVAYEVLRGPIHAGLEIDHLCRVPLCINPAHLEPVTPKENQRRGKGSYTTCKRGHPFDEKNTATRINVRLGKAQRACRKCDADRAAARRAAIA